MVKVEANSQINEPEFSSLRVFREATGIHDNIQQQLGNALVGSGLGQINVEFHISADSHVSIVNAKETLALFASKQVVADNASLSELGAYLNDELPDEVDDELDLTVKPYDILKARPSPNKQRIRPLTDKDGKDMCGNYIFRSRTDEYLITERQVVKAAMLRFFRKNSTDPNTPKIWTNHASPRLWIATVSGSLEDKERFEEFLNESQEIPVSIPLTPLWFQKV